MACDNCKKKGIGIDCKYCIGSYCSKCIQLEVHLCSGMHEKKKDQILKLKENLSFEQKKKVTSI